MEALLWIGAVIVIVTVMVVGFHLKMVRRRDLAAFAFAHGLEFSARDPFFLLSLPFPLLSKGDGRGVENVLWGEWQGRKLTAFDYWYYDESHSSDGGSSRTYHRFSCVVQDLPLPLPDLHAGPEGIAGWLADRVGMPDITFESAEFNRRYDVQAPIRQFAYELLDARMIRWLLSLRRPLSFDVSGTHALVSSKRLRPAQMTALLGAAAAFRKRIPRVVWSLYGPPASVDSPRQPDLA